MKKFVLAVLITAATLAPAVSVASSSRGLHKCPNDASPLVWNSIRVCRYNKTLATAIGRTSIIGAQFVERYNTTVIVLTEIHGSRTITLYERNGELKVVSNPENIGLVHNDLGVVRSLIMLVKL